MVHRRNISISEKVRGKEHFKEQKQDEHQWSIFGRVEPYILFGIYFKQTMDKIACYVKGLFQIFHQNFLITIDIIQLTKL